MEDARNNNRLVSSLVRLRGSFMYLVLATAVTLSSCCNTDDELAVLRGFIDLIPSGEAIPLTPPETRWQVLVGDTNTLVESNTNLFQLQDGAFTCGIGQDDVRFHVVTEIGTKLAENIISTTNGRGIRTYSTPVLVDDDFVIEFGIGQKRLNPLTGEIVWENTENGRFTPSKAGGMLEQSGYRIPISFLTVDNETGNTNLIQYIDGIQTHHLQYHFTEAIESSAGEKLIVVGLKLIDSLLPSGGNYQIQVRDYETFNLRWSFDTEQGNYSYEAKFFIEGDLLVLPVDDTMYGFNILTGEVTWLWTWDPETYESQSGGLTKLSGFNFNQIDFDASIDLVVASGYQQIFAFRASTGQIIWQRDMDDDGGVFIVDEDHGIYSTQVGYHVLIDLNNGIEIGRITPLNDTYPYVHSRGFATDDGEGVVLFDGMSIFAVDFEKFVLEE